MNPSDPTGTTYQRPDHDCGCTFTVKYRGRTDWVCSHASNAGRDIERAEIVAHGYKLMALVSWREDLDPAMRQIFRLAIRAYQIEIVAKAHVTE